MCVHVEGNAHASMMCACIFVIYGVGTSCIVCSLALRKFMFSNSLLDFSSGQYFLLIQVHLVQLFPTSFFLFLQNYVMPTTENDNFGPCNVLLFYMFMLNLL